MSDAFFAHVYQRLMAILHKMTTRLASGRPVCILLTYNAAIAGSEEHKGLSDQDERRGTGGSEYEPSVWSSSGWERCIDALKVFSTSLSASVENCIHVIYLRFSRCSMSLRLNPEPTGIVWLPRLHYGIQDIPKMPYEPFSRIPLPQK